MPKPTLKFFKDRRKEWRWTFIGANGRKIATSGEGYKRPSGAWLAFGRFQDLIYITTFDIKGLPKGTDTRSMY